MSIQEKINARFSERKNDAVSSAVRKAFIRIMCGYLGGTLIGLLLRRLLNG